MTSPLLRLFITLLAICLLPAGAPPVQATLMRPLSLAELAGHADSVVRGRVLAVDVAWAASGRMPVTFVQVEVMEVLAGRPAAGPATGPAAGDRITVSQPGGVKDDISLDYAGRPRFAPGEETVVFLARRGKGHYIPVGLAQGVFVVGPTEPGGRRGLVRHLDGVTVVADGPPSRVPADLDGLRRALAALPREVGAGGQP
jgi:hypothetical protein